MSNDTGVERTLVLFKPDAVARGLTGRILARFEDNLLKVVAGKMVWMDADLTRRHYFDLEERFGAVVYNSMAAFMQSGPVIAIVLEGVEAVACVRKMVGSTYPDQAAPGTIRGDFAHMSQRLRQRARHRRREPGARLWQPGGGGEGDRRLVRQGGTARLSHGGAAVPSVKLWR